MKNTKKKKNIEVLKRHMFFNKLAKLIVYPVLKRSYRYHTEKFDIKKGGPYLVIASHACAFDPIFIEASVNDHIYFVISEEFMNLGWKSKLLKYCFNLIPKAKGASDIVTIKKIKRIVSEGASVGLMPESNVTLNGETCLIPEAIGKLVKHLGIPVLFYETSGFYFNDPRWSVYRKHGNSYGRVKKIWTKEEYENLSVNEINDYVAEMLYQSAYASQEVEHTRFVGKERAKGLERILFMCPECGEILSTETCDDKLNCTKCGASMTYDEYGYLDG